MTMALATTTTATTYRPIEVATTATITYPFYLLFRQMAVAFFPLPAAATLVVDLDRRELCIVIFRIFLELYL